MKEKSWTGIQVAEAWSRPCLAQSWPHLRPPCLCRLGSEPAEKSNTSRISKAPTDLLLDPFPIVLSVYAARTWNPSAGQAHPGKGPTTSESLMKTSWVLWESGFTTCWEQVGFLLVFRMKYLIHKKRKEWSSQKSMGGGRCLTILLSRNHLEVAVFSQILSLCGSHWAPIGFFSSQQAFLPCSSHLQTSLLLCTFSVGETESQTSECKTL